MDRREALRQAALLTGVAVALPISTAILSGCQAEGALNWVPSFLTKDEAKALEEITETILPHSDTPGAKDVHLTEFIDLIVKDCFNSEDQIKFKTGLGQLLANFKTEYQKDFAVADEKDKVAFITSVDQKAFSDKSEQTPFYTTLKQLSLLGYFTSESVMTTQLNYNPIPTKYNGCIPYQSGEKVYVGDNVSGNL